MQGCLSVCANVRIDDFSHKYLSLIIFLARIHMARSIYSSRLLMPTHPSTTGSYSYRTLLSTYLLSSWLCCSSALCQDHGLPIAQSDLHDQPYSQRRLSCLCSFSIAAVSPVIPRRAISEAIEKCPIFTGKPDRKKRKTSARVRSRVFGHERLRPSARLFVCVPF